MAAYALGALDEGERDAAEAHIAECGRCREDLRWIQAATEVLPATVSPRDPPARLRRRLLAAVHAEARAEDAPAAGDARRRFVPAVARPVLAGIAAVLLVAAGVAGYVAGDSGGVDETTLTARATGAAPSAAAASLVRAGDSGTLRTSGLPQPGGGGVYQVWIRESGMIMPSTVFVVDRTGAGVAAIPAGLDEGDEVMVTREPSGGSDQPTTPPLLRAPLS